MEDVFWRWLYIKSVFVCIFTVYSCPRMRLGLFSQSVVLGFESDNGRQRRKSRQTGHFFLIEQASKIDPPKVWKSSAWKGWFYGPGCDTGGRCIYKYTHCWTFLGKNAEKTLNICVSEAIWAKTTEKMHALDLIKGSPPRLAKKLSEQASRGLFWACLELGLEN